MYNISLAEYNERMGQMTHYGCDPSPNFLPQEYSLPQTLTTFRTMVRICTHIFKNGKKSGPKVA